jgi:hypothetical protein
MEEAAANIEPVGRVSARLWIVGPSRRSQMVTATSSVLVYCAETDTPFGQIPFKRSDKRSDNCGAVPVQGDNAAPL